MDVEYHIKLSTMMQHFNLDILTDPTLNTAQRLLYCSWRQSNL